MTLSMERWVGKVAVVTGASAGIGAAISQRLVEEGIKVVGLARRKEKLEELAALLRGKKGKFYALEGDVTKEETILKAFKWIRENLEPIHILVNNAGVVRNTSLIDGETKLWKDVLDTNVLGLCIATREAVKNMRENNVIGHIIHIGSEAGHKVVDTPNFNVYFASKYAVTALAETLRYELNRIGSKIKISAICPGLVETDIFNAEATANGFENSNKREKLVNAMKTCALKPSDIVDAVVYALSTPPDVQIQDIQLKSMKTSKRRFDTEIIEA